MSKTKQRITQAAVSLFNRNGIVNVRLQHIADEAVISVGNLAYHFANKEALVKAIYEDLKSEQQDLLSRYRIVPLFENIDRIFSSTYTLQEQYQFFYLDTLEIVRAYPEVGALHRLHIESQINQFLMMLDFNVSRGALKDSLDEFRANRLANQIWLTMDLWRSQMAIRSENSPNIETYLQSLWTLIMPYFTEMGTLEYNQMLERPYDFYF